MTGVFEPLALLPELPEGRILQRIRSSGEAVCLIRHQNHISAVSDICTHQHFAMSHGDLLNDGTLQCAWHGAQFDCRTGEVRQGPATAPLPVFAVRVVGNSIQVGGRAERIGAGYRASAAPVE